MDLVGFFLGLLYALILGYLIGHHELHDEAGERQLNGRIKELEGLLQRAEHRKGQGG